MVKKCLNTIRLGVSFWRCVICVSNVVLGHWWFAGVFRGEYYPRCFAVVVVIFLKKSCQFRVQWSSDSLMRIIRLALFWQRCCLWWQWGEVFQRDMTSIGFRLPDEDKPLGVFRSPVWSVCWSPFFSHFSCGSAPVARARGIAPMERRNLMGDPRRRV